MGGNGGGSRIRPEWVYYRCSDSRGPPASLGKFFFNGGYDGGLAPWSGLFVVSPFRLCGFRRFRVASLQLVCGYHLLYLAAVAYQTVGVRSQRVRNPIRAFELRG